VKLYFLTPQESPLAAQDGSTINAIRNDLLSRPEFDEASSAESSDAIILNEQFSFKEWRYVSRLIGDAVVGRYANKVYTINTDDIASGLLRGIYTSLPKIRCSTSLHRAVPYTWFPNEMVLQQRNHPRPQPDYLATWRGNPKSNKRLREGLLRNCRRSASFLVEPTDSWLEHGMKEKVHYVNVLRSGRFSLCPAGIAPVSFRIYESMALGICPVIIADSFVPPEGPRWSDFSIQIPEKRLRDMESILKGKSDSYLEMGDLAKKEWERFFSPEQVMRYYADSLLACMDKSLGFGSPEGELARWKSFGTYWRNGWTLSQRLCHRIRRLTCF